MSRSANRDREDEDEDEEESLGGWRPFGEAAFWGAVFLGLTAVAFSLGERGGDKTLSKAPVTEAVTPDDDKNDLAFEESNNVFKASSESELENEGEPPANKTNLPKTNQSKPSVLTSVNGKDQAPRNSQPVPTRRLNYESMMRKVIRETPLESWDPLVPSRRPNRLTSPAVEPKTEFVDRGPTRKLNVSGMMRLAQLSAATHRLDIESMFLQATLVTALRRLPIEDLSRFVTLIPAGHQLDWAAMLRLATLEPETQHLDWLALYRPVKFQPATHKLPWQQMVYRVENQPPTKQLNVLAMYRPVSLEPATRHLNWEEMTKRARFIPVPRELIEPAPIESPPIAVVPAIELPKPKSATKPTAVAIELKQLPLQRKLGQSLLVIARVLDANQKPLPEQLVEWTIDRQGVGQFVSVLNDPAVGKVGEKLLPTYARSYTASSPHRSDALYGNVDIQVGETWCVIDSASAGTLHLTVHAPAATSAANATAKRAIHWDRANAVFPGTLSAQAGTEIALITKVQARESNADIPLPDYRVRFTLTDEAGGEFANEQRQQEAESNGDGKAVTMLRQRTPAVGTSRGKVELLGRQPLAGEPAPVLAAGEFVVHWVAPEIKLEANGPAIAEIGEWIRLNINGTLANPSFGKNLRLRAVPPTDLQLQVGERGGAIDLGPWPTAENRPTDLVLKFDRPGSRAIRFEIVQGQHVWSTTEHTVRFSAPELELVAKSENRVRLGEPTKALLTVHNKSNVAARNWRVRQQIPEGLKVVRAADAEIGDGRIEWAIDRLEAGAKKTLPFEFAATSEGTKLLKATLQGPNNALVNTESEVAVEGVPALLVTIKDSQDPVEVGKDFVYVVEIENRGNSTARNAKASVVAPPGIELLAITGDLAGQLASGKINLDSIAELKPNDKRRATIKARIRTAGESRLVVKLSHPSLENGAIEEHESTVAYTP